MPAKPFTTRFCLVLLFTALVACLCRAADIHVLSSAAGSNDGTDWNNAYTNITAAESSMARGDTIWLGDGTYSGQFVFDVATNGTTFCYVKHATAGAHGSSTGWADSMGDGQAVIQWTGATNQSYVCQIETSYWEFDGVTGGGPGSWTNGHGIKITTDNPKATLLSIQYDVVNGPIPNDIHFYHVEFAHVGRDQNPNSHADAQSVKLNTAGTGGTTSLGGHEFRYCYFHDNPTGVFLTRSAKDTLFEYNYLRQNSSGVDDSPPSSVQGSGLTLYGATDNTIRYNVFEDIEGSSMIALYSIHGALNVSNVLIHGNTFFWTATNLANMLIQNGLIASESSTNTDPASFDGVKIYNNTFANMHAFKTWWADIGTNCAATNNILYFTRGIIEAANFDYFSHDYNWFYGNSDYRNTNSTDAAWVAMEVHSQLGSGNPFTDWTNGDFSLTANTTAGANLGSPFDVDATGRTRGTWTRGAYEFDTVAPVISAASTTPTSQTTATAQWTTDETCNTNTVVVWNAAGTNSWTASNGTDHTVGITGLTASTLYTNWFVSFDTSGNGTTNSEFTFTTLSATNDPTLTRVRITGGVTISGGVNIR